MKTPDNFHMYVKGEVPKIPFGRALKLTLDRNSVCMGDDMDAHAITLTAEAKQMLSAFLLWVGKEIGNLPNNYLWEARMGTTTVARLKLCPAEAELSIPDDTLRELTKRYKTKEIFLNCRF